MLDELLGRLNALDPKAKAQLVEEVERATAGLRWIPSPGPQTEAYLSDADEIFYGGQAGGGKTDLLIGTSLTSGTRSLVLRRTNKEASKLVDRYSEILGSRDGYNGQEHVWRLSDGKVIDIGGIQLEDDKQKYKGTPHDTILWDEVSDFTETQYKFVNIWNRSADPNQRCRIIAAGNPPTRPEGLWVIKRWAAWLDPKHPNPARPGEVRWYLQMVGEDEKEVEVDGPGPHWNGAEQVKARSRTFIRAKLSDNPFYAKTDYDAVLAGLDEPLRLAYREGRFDASLRDDPWQVIPTDWIRQAQARWTARPPSNVPMCAIAADIAQGGNDQTVLAMRFDGWYDKLKCIPGKLTPTGNEVAGLILANRTHEADIVIDMGGGWGGQTYMRLSDNNMTVQKYVGAEGSTRRTKDGKLKFRNKRTQAYWQFREALDPGQPSGSPIALPDDPELVADLTAPKYWIEANGICITNKEDVCDLIGRSPDKGDAVVMAWMSGARGLYTPKDIERHEQGRGRTAHPPVLRKTLGSRR